MWGCDQQMCAAQSEEKKFLVGLLVPQPHDKPKGRTGLGASVLTGEVASAYRGPRWVGGQQINKEAGRTGFSLL